MLENYQSDCDYNNAYTLQGHTVSMILERPEYISCIVNFLVYKNFHMEAVK